MVWDQLDAIRHLERDIPLDRSRHQIPSNYSHLTQSLGFKSKVALYDLGMSMVENEAVLWTP